MKKHAELLKIPKEYRRALVLLLKKLKEQYFPERYDCSFLDNVDEEELNGLVDDFLKNNWRCHGSLYAFNKRSRKSLYLTVLSSVKKHVLKIVILESEINYRKILDSEDGVVEQQGNENDGW